MHLTPGCTGMSERAIFGIQEISQNVLLVCNTCVQNNQRDRVLDQIASTREEADVKAITRCVEEVKQELAQIKTEVKAKPPPEPTKHIPAPTWVKSQNQPAVKRIYDGIRFRGIPESKAGTGRERYDEDVEQVKRILHFISVKNCLIGDVKRIGTYDQNKHSKHHLLGNKIVDV